MLPNLLFLLAGSASATDFTFVIENNSSSTWSAGVVAVLTEGVGFDELIAVGPAPRNSPNGNNQYDTYRFINNGSGCTGYGDTATLISRWATSVPPQAGPALFSSGPNRNAWTVPSLAPGASTPVTISADPGEVMSFVARVNGSADDFVAMHAIGATSDLTIDLFNSVDLPLFNARFDIGGYDVNARYSNDGAGASCSTTGCQPPSSNCYVAYDNGTTDGDAGGAQTPPVEPDFARWTGTVLGPVAGTFYANGVNAPTVLWHSVLQQYLMFFETLIGPADPLGCQFGTYGIGLATSPDGVDWTVQGTNVILGPDPATPHRCVAAHPTAMIDDNQVDVHLWFKSEQGRNACAGGPLSWGCTSYVGVSHAVVDPTVPSAPVVTETAGVVFPLTAAFGWPSVVRQDGTYTMLYQQGTSIWGAESTSPEGPFTASAAAVMTPGALAWNQTELYDASLMCEESASAPYLHSALYGGRTRSGAVVVLGGGGEAIATDPMDPASWLYGIDPITFSGADAYRHWDALRTDTGDTLLFFSEFVAGKPHIALGGTTDEWDPDLLHTRVCPQPSWWP